MSVSLKRLTGSRLAGTVMGDGDLDLLVLVPGLVSDVEGLLELK